MMRGEEIADYVINTQLVIGIAINYEPLLVRFFYINYYSIWKGGEIKASPNYKFTSYWHKWEVLCLRRTVRG